MGQDSCLVYGFQCTDAGAEFDAEAPSPSPGDGGGNNNNDAVDTCADLPKGSSIFTEVELEVSETQNVPDRRIIQEARPALPGHVRCLCCQPSMPRVHEHGRAARRGYLRLSLDTTCP